MEDQLRQLFEQALKNGKTFAPFRDGGTYVGNKLCVMGVIGQDTNLLLSLDKEVKNALESGWENWGPESHTENEYFQLGQKLRKEYVK